MSKTVSCPFCQTAITIDENASVVVCLSCGKGFSLGVVAQSGSMPQVPPPQYQTMPPQNQTMPPQYQTMPPQYQMIPPQYQTMPPQIKRRRPGNGLFVTGIVFNSLVIVAYLTCLLIFLGYSLGYYSLGYYFLFYVSICVFVIPAFILNLVSIYKYWSLLPNQFSRETTPGGAAGFMLIPFFNLYWIWALHLRLGAGLRQTAIRPNSARGCGVAAAILIFLGSTIFIVDLVYNFRFYHFSLPYEIALIVVCLLSRSFGLILQSIGYLIGICGYQKAAKSIEP